MNNEKFLDITGLGYYHDRAKTIFENKIEKVKVNGTEQTITNKEVNLQIPEVDITSGLYIENESHDFEINSNANGVTVTHNYDNTPQWSKELVDKTYVDTNAGKIDKIKVNGDAQIIVNKEVDIPVPRVNCVEGVDGKTKMVTIQDAFIDDGITFIRGTDTIGARFGDGTSSPVLMELPTKDYVDANGGKINKIKVNGTEQTITNKEVDISVPVCYSEEMGDTGKADMVEIYDDNCGFAITQYGYVTLMGPNQRTDHQFGLATRDYVDDSFRTEAQVQAAIDDALADITGMEFVLVDTLPATGEKGKIYLVPNSGTGSNVKDEYIWLTPEGGTAHFEKIGSTDVDLSDYWNNTNLTAITTAEIDALFA